MKNTILVRKRSDDYLAQVEGHRGIWACGTSVANAVGDLALTHKERFNIELDFAKEISHQPEVNIQSSVETVKNGGQ
jgi:hypothetical protein